MGPNSIVHLTHRDQLPAFLKERGTKSIVELGCNKGVFLKQLAKAEPELLVSVDIWCGIFDTPHSLLAELRAWGETLPFELRMLETSSLLAARMFAQQNVQFDFVYIDADHRYAAVVEDIAAWWPLVAVGDILAGHDYVGPSQAHRSRAYPGVKQAIDEFEERCGLHIHRDIECCSWMVEKP